MCVFVCVDDYSRFSWLIFLRDKLDTFEGFEILANKRSVQFSKSQVTMEGSENSYFDDFCNKNGIKHEFMAPKTPQQNGLIERRIGPYKKWSES